MKKRVRKFLGAGLLAIALAGMIWSIAQNLRNMDQPQASTQVEVNMDESISVLP